MNTDDLSKWILEVKNGQDSSFENIIKYYEKGLYKYIRFMVYDYFNSEDILQEVFFKVYSNLDKYKKEVSFDRWIYKIAYNHTINFLRRKKRDKILFMDEIPEYVLNEELLPDHSNEIDGVMKKLTVEERNLLYLRTYEELSYKEISQIYGKSENSLRKKYERLRKKFIGYYEKEVGNNGRRENEIISDPTN